jgi:protein dpy-30
VPLLMQGLQALCKERPEDPVEYLAHYLLQHNPQKAGAAAPTTADEGAAPAAPAAAAAPAPAQ